MPLILRLRAQHTSKILLYASLVPQTTRIESRSQHGMFVLAYRTVDSLLFSVQPPKNSWLLPTFLKSSRSFPSLTYLIRYVFQRFVNLCYIFQTDQKIRYSKWKAADIAKAFREGRKPEPGPPGATEELFNPPVVSIVSSGSPKTASPIGSHSPPKRSPPDSAPHTPHKPPQLDPSSLGPRWGGDVTPGSWSTAATPGSPRNLFSTVSDTFYHDPESPSAAKAQRDKKRTGSGSSSGSGSGSTASIGPKGGRRSSVSSGSPNGKKSVHFTPSVSGGLSSTDGSAPSSPASEIRHVLPEDIYAPTVHTPSTIYHEPQPSTPPLPPNLSNIYVSPAPPPAVPPAPQPSTYSPNSIYAPSGPAFSSPSIPQAEPVILTPAIIAKAQKHCRFAISSLDYEDAEQARKELRAALSALGG